MEAQAGKQAPGSTDTLAESRGRSPAQHRGQDTRRALGRKVPSSASKRSNFQDSLFQAWPELSREGEAVVIRLHWSLVGRIPLPNDTGPQLRLPGKSESSCPTEYGPLDSAL